MRETRRETESVGKCVRVCVRERATHTQLVPQADLVEEIGATHVGEETDLRLWHSPNSLLGDHAVLSA